MFSLPLFERSKAEFLRQSKAGFIDDDRMILPLKA